MFHTISTESIHFPISAHTPTCLSPFTCLSLCQPYTHLSQPLTRLSPSQSACLSASPWCTYPIPIPACSSGLRPPHTPIRLPVILHLPFLSVGPLAHVCMFGYTHICYTYAAHILLCVSLCSTHACLLVCCPSVSAPTSLPHVNTYLPTT